MLDVFIAVHYLCQRGLARCARHARAQVMAAPRGVGLSDQYVVAGNVSGLTDERSMYNRASFVLHAIEQPTQ